MSRYFLREATLTSSIWIWLTCCCSTASLPLSSFSLSTLHCMVISFPTLRPSEGSWRNPTVRQGSSTGRCKTIALLNTKALLSESDPEWSASTGLCAPAALSPLISYLIFRMLSGSCKSFPYVVQTISQFAVNTSTRMSFCMLTCVNDFWRKRTRVLTRCESSYRLYVTVSFITLSW